MIITISTVATTRMNVHGSMNPCKIPCWSTASGLFWPTLVISSWQANFAYIEIYGMNYALQHNRFQILLKPTYHSIYRLNSSKAPPPLYLPLVVEYSTNDFMPTRRLQWSIDIHAT